MPQIYSQQLQQDGFIIVQFPYSEELRPYVVTRNFLELDQLFLRELSKNGKYKKFLMEIVDTPFFEHIIAIRTDPDDDGIWHDDGSRYFGFSLSLNLVPSTISGGELLFKHKNSMDFQSIGPLPFGKMAIFLSGIYGYEHKVNQVLSGERIVIAGWGSNGPMQ